MTEAIVTATGQRARIDLGGEWTMRHFLEGTLSINSPDSLVAADLPGIPAQVPGNVELDLMAHGEIGDPFIGMNSTQLRPFEFHQFWYERHFPTPVFANPELVFNGLDCITDIWVNGRKLGSTANAMIPYRFSLNGLLRRRGEDNVLFVCIKSPINAAREHAGEPWEAAQAHNLEMLQLRKPAHCFGWDIMPRIVSAGIWRSVYLEDRPRNEIDDIYAVTHSCSEDNATCCAWINFHTSSLSLENLAIRISGSCDDSAFETMRPVNFTTAMLWFNIPKPKLWWPRGYGDANLYACCVELLEKGEVIARQHFTMGIRTIQLDRSELNTEEHRGKFRFIVNGVPVFVKGSNWVPADALHSRDAERIPNILELFKDMGCNMLRCWGGNVYEDQEFYDLCDQYGIMVWQDFSMACGAYPQNGEFLENFRKEAECVVKARRQHPCIALWAGDNENDCGYVGWWFPRRDPALNRLTREILPQVLNRLDPIRPYIPSSPYITPSIQALNGNERIGPEQHLWGPRDYYKSRFYADNTACFASETGYHGCPAIASLKRFITPEKLWPWKDNEEWNLHSTNPVPGLSDTGNRINLMSEQIREMIGSIPEKMEEYVLMSQFIQAEAKKFFVENFRLHKGSKSGILWWNMMDGWPQISDAIVDYYFNRKLAYYYLRRVHKELCLMMTEPDSWNSHIIMGNDSRRERKGHFIVRKGLQRELVLEGDFCCPPNENRCVGTVRAPRSTQELFTMEWDADGEHGVNHYLMGTPPFDYAKICQWIELVRSLEPFEWSCL